MVKIGDVVRIGPAYEWRPGEKPDHVFVNDSFTGLKRVVVEKDGFDCGLSRHPEDDTEVWINEGRLEVSGW